jgi:hypothetical protein
MAWWNDRIRRFRAKPDKKIVDGQAVTAPHLNWEDIRGLSIGGRAAPVTDAQEINRVSELMLRVHKSCGTHWPAKKASF